MAFERIAENRIREAIKEGKLETPPRPGQPLDLEEYFALPEELRMAYSILRSANCVPEEVQLLKEIARLEHDVAVATDPEARAAASKELDERRVHLAVLLERRLAPAGSRTR